MTTPSICYPLTVGNGFTRIIEAGTGPAVLFIHGLGARADRWRTTVERIGALGFRAIACDLPGHGFASKEETAPSTVPAIADFILQVMDTLDIQSAPLVGTSLGAHIAAYAACTAPGRVPGLVLVGALGVVPISQDVAETISRNVRVQDKNLFGNKLKFVLYDTSGITPAMIEEEWRINTFPGAGAAFGRLGDYLVNGISADYVAERLSALYPPEKMLLVWGRQDKAVPPEVGEACRTALGNPELVFIDKSNHVPYLEQPEAFDAVVVPLLQRLVVSAA
ncbi:alpha/beta fold hydrolase [Komagataeibacter oboediens]|uniref:Alpha/beta hydrolase n=1 Tax=Komagataeibacter oboediens TaxID=65958 RepID=A0ABS5SR79_9PROT|nr:alpha/beta hydrolase [Komagataeibacter oboediens]MBL7234124.1 alpha/beta hydrolase [Komagataeibacter oboediens]MBT0675980.1 alpha/beta hydrolase [Komagataeibacter oboediens]MBT0679178.1 alpha/beta hydrolase [Komagataeibacter oboediens]